jgi:predicted lipoprotein with Yx(FWY)xxD motif
MQRRVLGFVIVVGMTAWMLSAVAPAGAASKPGAPGKPTVVSGNKSARVSWSAPTSGGSPITVYLVTPFVGTRAQTTVAFHSKKTTEIVGGLKNGKTYTFKVAAHNAVGTGKQSVASKAVTIGLPSAPSGLTASAGNAQATVAWKTPANGGLAISSYTVTPFLGAVAQSAQTFASTATAEVVTGLANSKSYSFRVAARNAAGIGPQSALVGPVQTTSAPALSMAHNTMLNEDILTDAYGNTVYMFLPDGSSTVSRAGSEEGLWPAVAYSGTPTVGAGLDQSKATVDVQPDGTRQLAFNGHLLYTFLYDGGPGSATGNGESSFYLLSPTGAEI